MVEESGKNVVRYLIEVKQHSIEGDYLEGWTVARRYNDFWNLHATLKSSSTVGPEIKARDLSVPAKRLLPKMTEAFVEARRMALEHYLGVGPMVLQND